MSSFQQLMHHKRHVRADFYNPSIPPQYPPDLELEPIHRDINLYIDIAGERASGQVTTTVIARGAKPAELVLDALDFEDITVRDPDGHDLTWRYDGRKLAVQWGTPFTPTEERRVEISYTVISPIDGLYFSQPNENYPDQAWYAATDHETERARYWLPCIDLPNVRTTLDFHLRADSRFTILTNGYLVDETENEDGTKTAHWRLDQRCPSYLTFFAVGDFVRADDGSYNDGQKEIPFVYFASREHSAADLLGTFGRTGAIMAWMTKKLGMPFPYPKYYQIAWPMMGGAMENISITSWGDRMVFDETLSQEYGWWVDLINAHEMSHSYFGDAIVCRDYAHAWLKESWATYMEQCWLEDNVSLDTRDYLYFVDSHSYFKEADERYKRPIVTRHFKSSWQMYDNHLYPGGACRLHTLRSELGDAVFWTAVRDYVQRYNGKVVETDHFRHVMEEHSGRSLGQFFDQWFFTAAYPDLKVTFSYDSKNKQGSFEIEQKQVDQEQNIPAFILKTDLSWVIDGQTSTVPVKLEKEKQVFIFDMPSEPEQVRFDPQGKILHKLEFNPGSTILRKQLTDDPTVTGRILAAKELVKSGKRNNIQAVVDAYAAESFWGVRQEMAEALAECNNETAVKGLAAIVAQEQDPKILGPIIQAAGEFRDKRITEALTARVEQGLPYFAASKAYHALGNQREQAPLDLLLAASLQSGYNGIAQSGAVRGLAASRRLEAVDPLLNLVGYGNSSNRVRPSAVSALADIGQGQEKARRDQIIEKLTDLLRDPWYNVGMAAASGLQTMEASEAIPALEAFSQNLSYQDQVVIEKIIGGLRSTDKVDGSAVKKQVEELRETIRKLEDRVENLSAKVEAAEKDEEEEK